MIRKNILSILAAVIIAWLSLSDADSFNKVSFLNFPGIDKLVHSGMYFILMSVITYENRRNIGRINVFLLIGLVPFSYGALMEVLQILVTTNREGSVTDLIFNLAGILLSIIICLSIRPFRKQIIK
jgi:VanZ family protein